MRDERVQAYKLEYDGGSFALFPNQDSIILGVNLPLLSLPRTNINYTILVYVVDRNQYQSRSIKGCVDFSCDGNP
jgi:hypothetical protein